MARASSCFVSSDLPASWSYATLGVRLRELRSAPWGSPPDPSMALIAPALVSADFARLGEALEIVKSAGASMIHIDVMDGHFAPDISMGQPVVASIRRATDLVLEVHLMVERPERYAAEFLEIGADRVSIHPEATPHLNRTLGLIRKRGAKAGLALNPATPVGLLSEVWDQIDFLTILGADPGGTEQAVISRTSSKVLAASRIR